MVFLVERRTVIVVFHYFFHYSVCMDDRSFSNHCPLIQTPSSFEARAAGG